MRLLRGRNAVRHPPRRAVVTIGMFDGVHVGHQRLIRTAVRLAKRLRGTSVVMTFDPDPQRVLAPAQAQPRLMPLEARLRLIRAAGAQVVWVIPFTRRFSRLDAEAFVKELLVTRLGACGVVVGEAFSFGRDRRGNLAVLRREARRFGFRLVVVPPVIREGGIVSSSRIRRLAQQGELATVRRLLGRPLQLHGTVVRGEGRARALGFPTANVRLPKESVQPPHGVYRVRVEVDGRPYQGLMNLGVRPTFASAGRVVCEVHLVGFRGSLYGRGVTLSLLKWVRSERHFASPDALARQIRQDLRQAGLLPRR